MMIIIYLIFGSFILAAAAGVIYAIFGIRRFRAVRQLKEKSRFLAWLVPLIPAAILVWATVRSPVTGVIICIHLLVFWILADILGAVVRRIRKKAAGCYWQGILAITVTTVYLAAGWYFAHHVVETDYALTTRKELDEGGLRIAQISDSHIGSTFHADKFADYMDRVQEAQPDLVVVTGDFVDDETTMEDMVGACRALGKLRAGYGVWFVYGNHDRGYYRYRKFTNDDLVRNLEENGVHVMTDEVAMLGEHVCLVGREDRSYRDRVSIETLMEEADADRYIIVLDHQPHELTAEAAAGADLVLCGHTHGGQMFPVGILGVLSGQNQQNYGLKMWGETAVIVNSGISDWAIPFKTAAIAEYGIIDVR